MQTRNRQRKRKIQHKNWWQRHRQRHRQAAMQATRVQLKFHAKHLSAHSTNLYPEIIANDLPDQAPSSASTSHSHSASVAVAVLFLLDPFPFPLPLPIPIPQFRASYLLTCTQFNPSCRPEDAKLEATYGAVAISTSRNRRLWTKSKMLLQLQSQTCRHLASRMGSQLFSIGGNHVIVDATHSCHLQRFIIAMLSNFFFLRLLLRIWWLENTWLPLWRWPCYWNWNLW